MAVKKINLYWNLFRLGPNYYGEDTRHGLDLGLVPLTFVSNLIQYKH